MTPKPLSADDSIKTWLDHPTGGPIIRELLAEAGQSPEVLRPVSRLALKRLIKLSKGQFSQAMVDDLVRRANAADGAVDAALDSAAASAAAEAASPEAAAPSEPAAPSAPEPAEWAERITPGRFDGKTVIVTGAGSGIGRATASRIAREGGRVVAVDVSRERLDQFVADHPGADVVALTADITDDAGVAEIVRAAGDRIDGLANIAGIMDDMTPVHELTDAVWRRVFAVNVDGTMKLMRAVVPAMLAAAAGSIVNTASEAALRGSAAGVAYTASKHAVVGLTKSSAFMYGPSGIRVNAVAPGPTITNIEASFGSPLGADRVQTAMAVMPDPAGADALAASITFLLSDDGVNINGVVLASDGGWSAA
ncbi:SDR family NAD(P)-dependent oxidoreductase [Leifsonia aquatica]|uniref:NAD(P)-dependent dehydrogenase (Short-subunit alcohol dehydrogenase family) n=3 Tax=Leifsonia aquatica TaxID=144185 RepID=A0A7W4USX1_LEIAQ|nr:SDR family NAD(P)-dependent oxidoreductase [Leifsonia aquatica]MBB2965668.1 NAD(P)-dependent dehydrogenase (short-subunit alcohol dehydrogenase family) [Leifsonia aquatica]